MTVWFAIGFALVGLLASAQITTPPADSGAGVFVLPRPGVPISLEQIEECSRKLDDGTFTVKILKSRIFRDSTGRLRIDSNTPGDSANPSTSYTDLMDPAAGLRFLLIHNEKVAYRLPYPKAAEGKFAFFGMGDERASLHTWIAKREDAGKRMIEGVEFEGTRIIQTSEGELALTHTVERWYSDELKLIGSVVTSGPYGTDAVRVQNLHREEPDSSLFKLPADYKIHDVQLPPDPSMIP